MLDKHVPEVLVGLAPLIGTIILLLVAIVLTPFVLCCCSRSREKRRAKDEEQQLLESNPPPTDSQPLDTPPSYGTTAHSARPSNGRKATISAGSKPSRLTKGGVGRRMDRNKEALSERNEKLSTAARRTSDLATGASNFADLTEQLANKYKKKKKKSSSKKDREDDTDSKKHKGIKVKWSKK